MNISYSSIKLEKILSNQRLIKKTYTSFHKKIENRLSEIKAANNLNEISHIPPPRRHKLDGMYMNCWGIDISKNFRIIVKPVGNWDENDLTSVENIEIIDICDYH